MPALGFRRTQTCRLNHGFGVRASATSATADLTDSSEPPPVLSVRGDAPSPVRPCSVGVFDLRLPEAVDIMVIDLCVRFSAYRLERPRALLLDFEALFAREPRDVGRERAP